MSDELRVTDDLPRRLTRRLVWANLVAGALVVIYFDLAAPPFHASKVMQILGGAASFVVLSLVLVPFVAWRTRKRLALAAAWFEQSRAPTPAERDAVLELPWRIALVIARTWCVVAILAPSTSWQVPRYAVAVFIGISIGGLTAAGLSFLLAERLIRPTAALVLEGEAPEQPRTIGLRSRIILDAIVSAVSAEGGWVNKFEGDGALCVFGAPVDQPDHAARALRAARAIRDGMARLDLTVGVGVSSGPAVAGNVGAEQRYEYTVIGRPVHQAARACELAKQLPSHVLATEASVCGAGGEADAWRPAGSVELRGFASVTAVYEA